VDVFLKFKSDEVITPASVYGPKNGHGQGLGGQSPSALNHD